MLHGPTVVIAAVTRCLYDGSTMNRRATVPSAVFGIGGEG